MKNKLQIKFLFTINPKRKGKRAIKYKCYYCTLKPYVP